MRPRHAAFYIALGVALGLFLQLAANMRAAEAGSAGPAFPVAKSDTAYT